MVQMKERLKSLVRAGVVAAGIAGGWKIGAQTSESDPQADMPRQAITQLVKDVRKQIDSNMPLEDRVRLEQLLEVMSKTAEGCRLLSTLENEGTLLCVVDSFEKETILGQATGTEKIEIKRSCLHQPKGLWTLAHEAGHIQNHVNFSDLPQTLDDAYTLNTIDEALAERGAFLVFKQAQQLAPDFMAEEDYYAALKDLGYGFLQDQGVAMKSAEGKIVFDTRMQNKKNNAWIYESQAKDFYTSSYISRLSSDKPVLIKNPNWNDVVQKMSGGAVQSISHLPIPSWDLIGDMIIKDNRYGTPSVDRADLSCAKEYKDELLQGDGFKLEIFQRIKCLLGRLHADTRPEILEIFKELMPESYMQTFQRKGWVPALSLTEDGESFMREQTNQGYLNKALNALKNKDLLKVAEEDEISKMNIEETTLIFKTYQHVFFGGKNQRHLSPRSLQNIHL